MKSHDRMKSAGERVASIQFSRTSSALVAPTALGLRRAPVTGEAELGPALRAAFDQDGFAVNALYQGSD